MGKSFFEKNPAGKRGFSSVFFLSVNIRKGGQTPSRKKAADSAVRKGYGQETVCRLPVTFSERERDYLLKAMDDVLNDSPDDRFSGIGEFDGLEFFVFGTQLRFGAVEEETFDHKIAVNTGDHDIAAGCLDTAVDDEKIIGENACADHRFTGDPNDKGCRRIVDEKTAEIKLFFGVSGRILGELVGGIERITETALVNEVEDLVD